MNEIEIIVEFILTSGILVLFLCLSPIYFIGIFVFSVLVGFFSTKFMFWLGDKV